MVGFVPWFVVWVLAGFVIRCIYGGKGRAGVWVYWAFPHAQASLGGALCHSPVQQEQRGITRGPWAPCSLGRGGKAWPQPAPTLSLFPWQIHSDSDEGDGSIKYTISGEGAGTIFLIDEITGDIHATERLDREQKTFYTLRAQARDRQTDQLLEPESEFIIKVQDINDSEPRFLEGPYIGSVAELSPVGRSGWEAVGWGNPRASPVKP